MVVNSLAYVFYDASINSVVDNEIARVNARKTFIEETHFLKRRKDFLLSSQSSRMLAVLKMWMITFVLIAFTLAMFNLRKVFPFLSELAVVIFTLCVLSIGLMYLFILYTDYAKRDRVDYSKINFSLLEDVKPKKEDETHDGTSIYDLLKRDPNTCVGVACCPTGKVLENNVCK